MKSLRIYYGIVAASLAALMALLSACSGGISPIKGDSDDLNIVANIYDNPIYLEEAEYLTYNYKLEMEAQYGEGIWDNAESTEEYSEELKRRVENAMLENASFIAVCEEYGVDIYDKDTENYVKDYIDSFAEELGGKDEYVKQLKENGMTDHLLRYMLSIESSREELRQKLCAEGIIDDSDENARNIIESDEFIRTLHIFISNDYGDSIEENREKAEFVLSQLDAGEPFNRMIGRHSEDVYMTTTDGYYFTRGEYEEAYEDAAFALNVGEYSDVVETESGFYIIIRLEKDADYINKNFDTLKDRYLYVQFENVISDKAETAELVYTEFGKTLDFTSLGEK